ncbi:MAG TPA: hypothetical protein VM782_05510 [Stellaceae bacterium]|nr:hypothetical protein [Stellaceae bacterium]
MTALAVAGLVLWSVTARAQQPAAGEGLLLPLNLPADADTGKPRFFVSPPAGSPPSQCAPAFDCRLRVIGEIRRNGAVELNASIFKW